jgi:hypothetical protein
MTKNSATVQEDGPSAYNYHYEVVDGPHFSAWEKRQGYSTQVSKSIENYLLNSGSRRPEAFLPSLLTFILISRAKIIFPFLEDTYRGSRISKEHHVFFAVVGIGSSSPLHHIC